MVDVQLIMNDSEFAEAIAKATENMLRETYGLDVTTSLQQTPKTNVELTGINFKFEGSSIAPNYYVDELYADYRKGIPIENITKRVCEDVKRAHESAPEIPNLTPDEAREHIILTLVNTERNQKLIANCPHFEVGDLTAIPRWTVAEDMSFVVTNQIAANMQLTPNEVLLIGQHNVDETEFKIQPMEQAMRELFESQGMDQSDLDLLFPGEVNCPKMLVVTAQNNFQGSRAILSENAMNQALSILDTDSAIILPSSIHEVLVLPDDGKMTEKELRAMVNEVNATQVPVQDYLSDSVYKYDGRKITVMREDLKMNSPKTDQPKVERTVHYSGMKM